MIIGQSNSPKCWPSIKRSASAINKYSNPTGGIHPQSCCGDGLSNQRGRPNRITSHVGSLVLLAMVGAMVMMVIADNVKAPFHWSAHRIVRFRTRLRSPWDIAFVFSARRRHRCGCIRMEGRHYGHLHDFPGRFDSLHFARGGMRRRFRRCVAM